eukprot:scaffold428248_cov41-Prasinocladus_malaysianus.AAC.1
MEAASPASESLIVQYGTRVHIPQPNRHSVPACPQVNGREVVAHLPRRIAYPIAGISLAARPMGIPAPALEIVVVQQGAIMSV